MKNIRFFSENFHFFGGKCSVYLNRHIFVMQTVIYLVNMAENQVPDINGRVA